MNRKHYNIIFTLLAICIILLITDLTTGIWFWNRENLFFDSTKFNNITTPLISIIALIIYTIALFTTINQNKIILSQNIKPHFEREIEELVKKAEEIKFIYTYNQEIKEYNALNYISGITLTYRNLRLNADFINDYQNPDNIPKTYNNLKTRSYFGSILFLSDIGLGFELGFFYSELQNVIKEINLSQLIETDKDHIKKRIFRTFLNEYFALIEYEKKTDSNKFMVESVLIENYEINIKWTKFSEARVSEHYKWFSEEFKKYKI